VSAVDESGIHLGMEGGKVESSVHFSWISRIPLDAIVLGEQAFIQPKAVRLSA
jgi:hypothetical protein